MYKNQRLQAGQLPREHLLSFILNFIIAKYLQQEVDDGLTIAWMNLAPVASL